MCTCTLREVLQRIDPVPVTRSFASVGAAAASLQPAPTFDVPARLESWSAVLPPAANSGITSANAAHPPASLNRLATRCSLRRVRDPWSNPTSTAIARVTSVGRAASSEVVPVGEAAADVYEPLGQIQRLARRSGVEGSPGGAGASRGITDGAQQCPAEPASLELWPHVHVVDASEIADNKTPGGERRPRVSWLRQRVKRRGHPPGLPAALETDRVKRRRVTDLQR